MILLLACSEPPPPPPAEPPPVAKPSPEEKKAARAAARTGLAPVDGLTFPTDDATLNAWITAADQASIDAHAWQLWAAATGDLAGAPALTRWRTPTEGLDDIQLGGTELPAATHPLARPTGLLGETASPVLSSVLWSPAAALSIGMQDLLSSSALSQRVDAKVSGVELDRRALVAQPAWVRLGQGVQPLPVWPGPEGRASTPDTWKRCVWVDTAEPGPGTGDGSSGSCDASGRTPATTYGLGSFVQFRLSEAEANALVSIEPEARAGDVVVLAGLNLASHEVERWTWQAFWWQPDAQPPAPAHPTRPTGQRYAMCTAWSMVEPDQPATGGVGTAPVTCYNPWLEAGLGELPGSTSWTWKGARHAPKLGVESNCMSCHALAAWDPKGGQPALPAARYVELTPPPGGVRLDFLWSVARSVR